MKAQQEDRVVRGISDSMLHCSIARVVRTNKKQNDNNNQQPSKTTNQTDNPQNNKSIQKIKI